MLVIVVPHAIAPAKRTAPGRTVLREPSHKPQAVSQDYEPGLVSCIRYLPTALLRSCFLVLQAFSVMPCATSFSPILKYRFSDTPLLIMNFLVSSASLCVAKTEHQLGSILPLSATHPNLSGSHYFGSAYLVPGMPTIAKHLQYLYRDINYRPATVANCGATKLTSFHSKQNIEELLLQKYLMWIALFELKICGKSLELPILLFIKRNPNLLKQIRSRWIDWLLIITLQQYIFYAASLRYRLNFQYLQTVLQHVKLRNILHWFSEDTTRVIWKRLNPHDITLNWLFFLVDRLFLIYHKIVISVMLIVKEPTLNYLNATDRTVLFSIRLDMSLAISYHLSVFMQKFNVLFKFYISNQN